MIFQRSPSVRLKSESPGNPSPSGVNECNRLLTKRPVEAGQNAV